MAVLLEEAMALESALVTGGAGFVGSHLVDRLLGLGWKVSVLDNLSTGSRQHIERHMKDPSFRFFQADVNDRAVLAEAMKGCGYVFHLAADPVIRGGFDDEGRRSSPVKNNVLGTHAVLEAMVGSGAECIAFSSSSAVYGEAKIVPTPESYGPLRPISIYGASKLAAEGLVTAYSHGIGFTYWIFRFANIVGRRARQGVVCDFIAKLKENPQVLEILGDGTQEKCYMHVGDCVNSMLYCIERSQDQIFNLGSQTPITVTRVAQIVTEEMGLEGVRFAYTGGERGWRGDIARTHLDIGKLRGLGFRPRYDSEEAVRRAVGEILEGETDQIGD